MRNRLTLNRVFLVTVAHAGAGYEGRVVGVKDQVKVRLGEIDTPESKQPYGTRAKQALSDLVFNQQVQVVVQDTDRYGRVVGRVYRGGLDVNAELVKQGAAWVYRNYAKDQRLFTLEDEARAARRGLWALPEAERQPPWEWRQAERKGSSGKLPGSSTGGFWGSWWSSGKGYKCGNKRYCREMSSCEEAKFYLKQCGLKSLDRNGDGVPCEALCR